MLPKDTFKGRYSTYQLQDVIGKGGNAVVYSALDTVTQKMVAIKRMIAADESMLHRWRIEVEALISLREQGTNSQFVVAYLDHMQAGKAIMLVEEYAPNGSLLGLLRRGENKGTGLLENRVVACMYQVTRGLEYIHSKHIVHRDLKCANVLLFDDGRLLKLSDFGLAAGGPPPTALSAADAEVEGGGGAGKSEEEGVLGSVYWMAPEIACGKPHSTSSDVWSLGCLCVELLTGRPPFFDREPVNALYCIAEGSVSPMPKRLSLSDDCRSFLQECFHTDPSLRPSAARLVQHRWFSELRIDSRLAELAATNHSAVTREGSALAESGRSATSMGLLSASGSTREQWSPTASFTRAHTGASSPPAANAKGSGSGSRGGRASGDVRALFDDDKATEDRLGQFVEHALFFKPAAECEQWLRGQGLKRVVDSLDTAIPLDAYDVLNLIAHAAKSSEPKHELVLTALGETDLWGSQKLLQPTTRSDLAIIFSGCCRRQSPEVPFYTPCDCHALHFLLNTDGSDAESARVVEPAHSAIRALHTLFVAPLPSQGHGPGEAAAGAENAVARAAHRPQAMQLFVAGGGFEEVRRVVERQCERSLRTTTDPSLGWPAIAMLIEVLTAVESDLASLCTGPTLAAASLPSWTPPTSTTSMPAAGNSITRECAQDTVRLAAAACRLLVGPHIASKRYDAISLSFSEAVPASESTTAGVGLAASLRSPNASMVALVPPSPMPSSTIAVAGTSRTGSGEAMRQPSTPHTAGILPSSAADESGGLGARSIVADPSTSQPAVEDAVDNSTLGGASPTVRWFLGLQHASRSHHCLPAVLLLLRYADDSAATHAPYLDDVGRWLGRSVLLIASYKEEDPIARLHALSVLASLAQASPVTQAALRDGDVAVPVLTYVTLHPPPIDGAQRAVLECVSGLCRFDTRFAAITLAPGSPMVATLITVLHTASELAGLGPGEPTLTNGEAEARVARLEEEATACGRRPQEEMSMCLALLSQAAVLAKNTSAAAANSGGTGAPNVSGVGDSHGGGGAAWMAEPTLVAALMMDLNAMEDKLPQDNSAAEALRASARSLQAELRAATPQHA